MSESSRPTLFIVGSIICSLIALIFLPPVFGGAALILAYHVYKQNEHAGRIYLTVAAGALLVGNVILAIFAASQSVSSYGFGY